MTHQHVCLVNGPNLGLLGLRQPHLYGSRTLADVEALVREILTPAGIALTCAQSDVEGELVSFLNAQFLAVQKGAADLKGIIINPGAYTHTSVALRDALDMHREAKVPIFEVHISNVFAREEFRHRSFISPIATGVITGCGTFGYQAAALKIRDTLSHAP